MIWHEAARYKNYCLCPDHEDVTGRTLDDIVRNVAQQGGIVLRVLGGTDDDECIIAFVGRSR